MKDVISVDTTGRDTSLLENSIEVQNKMTKKAQNTLKESNNLNTSEEHIKDTSLDEIIFRCFDQGHYWGQFTEHTNMPVMVSKPDEPDKPIDRTEAVKLVNQWHKAEIAKLLQVIEDEVDKHDPSTGRATSKAYWGNTLREALKKLKDNVINGGSL